MNPILSRRDVLRSSAVVSAGVVLVGCNQSSSALPGVKWPDGPVVSPPPPAAPARPETLAGVLPRSAWTRAGVAKPSDINPMNGIRRITIHHDGMAPVTISAQADCARRIENIRNGHVGGNGWADIGYHYVIDPAGRVWEARSVRYQGAHVKDNNPNNLGILCMGNFEQQHPTKPQLATLDRFVAQQMQRYNVPISRVYTHREIKPTACPGRNLQGYMVATRANSGNLRRLAMAANPALVA